MYENYVGDSLFYLQERQHAISAKYSDIINQKVDIRTGDEIALDIIKRSGLKVVSKE